MLPALLAAHLVAALASLTAAAAPECGATFSVALVPHPFTALPALPTHPCVAFRVLAPPAGAPRRPVQLAFLRAAAGSGYHAVPPSVGAYREDMAVSALAAAATAGARPDEHVLFVPAGGMTDGDAGRLYAYLLGMGGDACAHQLQLDGAQRAALGPSLAGGVFVPSWPGVGYRHLGGLLLGGATAHRVREFMFTTWYLNRYDVLVQHFCEVFSRGVAVSGTNVFAGAPALQ